MLVEGWQGGQTHPASRRPSEFEAEDDRADDSRDVLLRA